MRANSLNHFKSIFTHKFFIKPADQNYYLARWSRIHGFHQEFYWQSLQAIEKYLKANLVINDISTTKSNHNIKGLFECHKTCCADLSIANLTKPPLLEDRYWQQETVEDFIFQIDEQGQPDSRYGLISWANKPCDLFKLDQVVFAVRRLSVGLDWIVGEDWDVAVDERYKDIAKHKGETFRDVLKQLPRYQVRKMTEVPDIPTNTAGLSLPDIMYAWNFSYCRSEDDVEKSAPKTVTSLFGPAENSYLFLLDEYLSKENYRIDPFLADGVEWLLSHIRINNKAKNSFQRKLSEIRANTAILFQISGVKQSCLYRGNKQH